MSDITIIASGEFSVAIVSGETEEAIDFIDAWYPSRRDASYMVVDSGRLVIAASEVSELVSSAIVNGLKVTRIKGIL